MKGGFSNAELLKYICIPCVPVVLDYPVDGFLIERFASSITKFKSLLFLSIGIGKAVLYRINRYAEYLA